ncbi:MAG: bifunctional riboflavin kinase/FAD synthetase [Deltaproteobacteria bacterium]|nr:bifunctional riboflavin kinase/FAD synthetase [Deltaproteobacteria bacterium]
MDVVRHIATSSRRFVAPVLTLGTFDGVHRGHQAIFERVVGAARASGGEAVAITFHPHPVAVLRPDQAPALITSVRDRVGFLAAAGIDVLILQHFTAAFAELSAEAFVERFVVERVGASRVVVGHKVSFGHARRGDATLLAALGARFGFAVEVVGPIRVDGHDVSSSAVRRAVAAGDMPLAAKLLGRPHRLGGVVVRGRRRGAAIGFPTANLRVRSGMWPPDGVYAVRVRRGERWLDGVANIGTNPTFGVAPRTLEVYVFDFDADVYGERLTVGFVERLRGEVAFPSVEALVAQIARDVVEARAVLART